MLELAALLRRGRYKEKDPNLESQMASDEKYPTLYSTEGRQLISDHLTALDNDEYKTACKKMRAASRDVMQHQSQFLADLS